MGKTTLFETFRLKGLSPREAETAELVSKGMTNKDVANLLFVTEKTVKFHMTNIYKKMHVKSRAQLIVWCQPHLSFEEKVAAVEPAEIEEFSTTGLPEGKAGNA